MTDDKDPAIVRPDHHRNNLDFVRLSLAVAVIFSHSFPILQIRNDFEPLDRATRHGFDVGKAAVVGFFAISGLLVAQSWIRTNNLAKFLEKRSLRILPGYAVAVLVCIFLVTPLVGSFHASWRHLLLRGVEFEALQHPTILTKTPLPYLNGSLWTIRYEFYCYLILAAMGLTGVLSRPWATLAALSVSLGLIVVGRHRDLTVTGIGDLVAWGRFLPPFLIGAVMFHYRRMVPMHGLILIVAIVILVILFRYHVFLHTGSLAAVFMPFVVTYGVLYVGFHPTLNLHNFGKFGDFSYGTYLYAWPMQQLLVFYARPGLNPWLLFLIVTPAAILAGVASWHLVERPMLRFKPGKFVRRLAA